MITIKTFEVNPLQENCYVVSDETREAVIIDCGTFYDGEFQAVREYIEANGLKPVAQLLTHAHFDHTFGAGQVYKEYGLKARFHVEDAPMFYHGEEQPSIYMQHDVLHRDVGPAGEYVDENTVITFGSHKLTVFHTPGHTQGCVCYYCAEEHVLFTGDTLFCRSVGRTDHPGGDYNQLIQSLRTLLASLPDGVTVYSGHGPTTTTDAERRYNPFIN